MNRVNMDILIKANIKNIPMSDKKISPVLDMIKGHNAKYALQELKLINKKASIYIEKLLKSAIANAEHNFKLDPNKLVIHRIWATEGVKKMRKYGHGGAKGRVRIIRNYRSNIFVELKYGA